MFVEGEISAFAKPRIGGAPAPVWQCDVKTRWRDGKAERAIKRASNESPIVITAPEHGFRDGEKVTISGVGGNTAANGTWTITILTKNSFALVNSKGNAAYTTGGSASGPAPGSVQHALISFAAEPASSRTTVDFVNDENPCSSGGREACDAAALNQEQMLGFNDGKWGAAIETTAGGVTHSASARDMVGAGAWRYWLRGPAATQVIVEDLSPALRFDWGYKDRSTLQLKAAVRTAKDTTVEVKDASDLAKLPMPQAIFIDAEKVSVCAVKGNTLTLGVSACPGADGRGLDGTTAAVHRGTAVARIPSTQKADGPSERVLAHTHTAINATATTATIYTPEFLMSLPLPARLQIEDEEVTVCKVTTGQLTFGPDAQHCPDRSGRGTHGTSAAAHKPGVPIYSPEWTAAWEDAPSAEYRSLHPSFTLTFYPSWKGVKVDSILENTWITKLQDQFYRLTLKSGGSLGEKRLETALNHRAQTRWRKTYWEGAEPPETNIDYNLEYLVESKALPSFDLTKHISPTALATEISRFEKSDRGDINGTAQWMPEMPSPGGRGDIGLLPRWYVLYLYTFDPKLYAAMLGNAAVSGYAPVHYRESAPERSYDDGKTVSAFGRPLSVDARPQATTRVFGQIESRDAMAPLGLTSNLPRPDFSRRVDNWNADVAHQPSMAYVPYLITGDRYFLEELYFWAAYDAAFANPMSCEYCRHDDWAFLNESAAETRGLAWGWRALAHATWFAPDEAPEKAYFLQKLNNNIAIREGVMNFTQGAFYDPSPKSKWSWGRTVVAAGKSDPLLWGVRSLGLSTGDPTKTGGCYMEAPWMQNFNAIVWGHIEELGFSQISPVRKYRMGNLLHQILDPAYAPKTLVGAYYIPTRDGAKPCETSAPLANWAAIAAAVPEKEIADGQKRWAAGASDSDHAYPAIAMAAASYLFGIEDGDLKGEAAWKWMTENVAHQEVFNDNPKWALVPRATKAKR